ncbi:MAG: tyrosine-type recombinase/integrase [Chloroflexota bacterium]|nr:tyrosine-type recombinase/integrase [Chloroflexota bacterium]
MSLALAPLPSPPAAPDSDAVVRLWLARAYARSHSDGTVRAYTGAVQRFAAHLGRDVLTATQTEALWYAQALGECGMASATQAKHLAALRSLFSFAEDLGAVAKSPFRVVLAPRVAADGAPRMLSREELRAMLAAAAPKGRALLLLLATTGLRISEALDATWAHVYRDPTGNTGLRVVGKGGKARSVKLLPRVLQALEAWRTDAGPLWPARHGGRCSQQAADRMLARIAVAAGVRHVSAHWLRSYLATQAFVAGADLMQVQSDLGHASVRTTQRYIRLAKGLVRTSADLVAERL